MSSIRLEINTWLSFMLKKFDSHQLHGSVLVLVSFVFVSLLLLLFFFFVLFCFCSLVVRMIIASLHRYERLLT